RGVLDDHEIGELENALEGTRGDTAVEHFGFFLAILGRDFLALDGKRVFLRDDRKLALGEAGDRDRNAIGVLAGTLDVIGGIAGRGFGGSLIEQGEEAVEADGGTIKRSKVK